MLLFKSRVTPMDFHEYNRRQGLAQSNYRGAKDFDLEQD